MIPRTNMLGTNLNSVIASILGNSVGQGMPTSTAVRGKSKLPFGAMSGGYKPGTQSPISPIAQKAGNMQAGVSSGGNSFEFHTGTPEQLTQLMNLLGINSDSGGGDILSQFFGGSDYSPYIGEDIPAITGMSGVELPSDFDFEASPILQAPQYFGGE